MMEVDGVSKVDVVLDGVMGVWNAVLLNRWHFLLY